MAVAASVLFLFARLLCPDIAFADGNMAPSSTDDYVLGRDLYLTLSIENMPGAVKHLRRAVEIDPTNLRAWYTLAETYRTGMLMATTDVSKWKKESQKIRDFLVNLSSDPKRAAGYDPSILTDLAARTKGSAAIDLGNWTDAEAILRRKKVLESDSELNKGRDISYGVFLFGVGRISDAENVLTRARVADRYAGVIYSHLARVYAAMNDYERSLAILAEGMNLFTDSKTDVEQRWHPLLRRSALFTALATRDKGLIAAKADSIKDSDLGAGHLDKKLASLLTDGQALKRTLDEMWSDPVNQHGYRAESIAIWAAYAGHNDLALSALNHLPNDLAAPALWHPVMANIRNTSGFRNLVQETGLLNYWLNSGEWSEFCRPVGTHDFECTASTRRAG